MLESTARKEWKSALRGLEDALAWRELREAGGELRLVDLSSLRPHEEFEREGVEVMKSRILREGGLDNPILVAKGEGIVLNGHHRLQALKELGAARAPVVEMDYASDLISVEVFPGAKHDSMTKELVLEAGRTGKLMPPKSSRHRVQVDVPDRFHTLEELGIPSTLATGKG